MDHTINNDDCNIKLSINDNLKKNAIIALALNICTQKSLFNKIIHETNYIFPKVKPDFILIDEFNIDHYIMHCNYIRMHNDSGLKI